MPAAIVSSTLSLTGLSAVAARSIRPALRASLAELCGVRVRAVTIVGFVETTHARRLADAVTTHIDFTVAAPAEHVAAVTGSLTALHSDAVVRSLEQHVA